MKDTGIQAQPPPEKDLSQCPDCQTVTMKEYINTLTQNYKYQVKFHNLKGWVHGKLAKSAKRQRTQTCEGASLNSLSALPTPALKMTQFPSPGRTWEAANNFSPPLTLGLQPWAQG